MDYAIIAVIVLIWLWPLWKFLAHVIVFTLFEIAHRLSDGARSYWRWTVKTRRTLTPARGTINNLNLQHFPGLGRGHDRRPESGQSIPGPSRPGWVESRHSRAPPATASRMAAAIGPSRRAAGRRNACRARTKRPERLRRTAHFNLIARLPSKEES